ncbi:MAG: phosphocholine cytidylyltransferase family protein [Synergistaceae bacterium]|jgi:CTP:phosphocholine cytidylyltransferase-like protein|nr:phosphocholine cytidylyltransferase family protein [Synergistaceae bacterium]
MLTRDQFDVLTAIEAENNDQIKGHTQWLPKLSYIGTFDKTLKELNELDLAKKGAITTKGLDALEVYRARRAIILAAGLGERMLPLTMNIPKPLVRVNGVRLIDTALDALRRTGITDVTIVRGHLAEQFDQLLGEYPFVSFVENPVYKDTNNISSMMCVRHLLKNAYVLEADLLIHNRNLITKYQYCSNYLGIPAEVSDNWCLESKDGMVTSLTEGGRDCHVMIGLSYWTERHGGMIADHIERVYKMPGGRKLFWDQAFWEYFGERYDNVTIRECKQEDVVEIDTYDDLKKLDSSYP